MSEDRYEGKTIKELVIEILKGQEYQNGKLADHERRIRLIEKWFWRASGGIAVLVAVLQFLN